MGMFDTLYDDAAPSWDGWQTKAYKCALDEYRVGDVMPPIVGGPDTYQVEVKGEPNEREFVDAFATVRGGRLEAVGIARDRDLPLVNYGGGTW